MRLLHFGGVEATARWQGHAEQLERPPRPGAKSPEQGRSYTRLTGKSIEGERVTDGFVIASKRGMPVERRSPAVCNVSDHKEGKDEMTKASIHLQDLRRRIYVKAKAETSWKF